jgi:PIN domain nuclease of toxin-antitoxin system
LKLLLDSHLLLWAASEPERISGETRDLIAASERYFSAASLWELAIKSALGRRDFVVDVAALHQGLRDNRYGELAVTGAHALFTANLPPIHKDPFDRILVAQAILEGLTLLTVDVTVARYGGAVRLV